MTDAEKRWFLDSWIFTQVVTWHVTSTWGVLCRAHPTFVGTRYVTVVYRQIGLTDGFGPKTFE